MGVAAPLTPVFRWQVKIAQGYSFPRGYMKDINLLHSFPVGIGIIQDPLIARQVGIVSVPGHDPWPARAKNSQIESIFMDQKYTKLPGLHASQIVFQ